MAKGKRKSLPQTIRFEVFKRDKFTCQYCGKSAPDVILEIDHIIPVSKGGSNDIMNLVTACRECNRGKTNKNLDDNSTVRIQKKQLDDLQERREQLEMMVTWRQALTNDIDIEVDAIDVLIGTQADNEQAHLTDNGKKSVRKLIRRFGFNEVYTAFEIALSQYRSSTREELEYAFMKVGGICYNRKKRAEENAEQDT